MPAARAALQACRGPVWLASVLTTGTHSPLSRIFEMRTKGSLLLHVSTLSRLEAARDSDTCAAGAAQHA